MSNVTIAVDTAKNVFEIAISAAAGRIQERRRMTRHQFERFWSTREPCRVVMEGCSGSHYWARLLIGLGFEVKLIPPHYVTPYRRRNKTDRADCEAILEADRCAGIHGITVKSEAQQAIMTLHRVRSQWMATRTARINAMRGMLRELGVTCALGAERFLTELHQVLERNRERLPDRIRRMVTLLWEEVRELERRIEAVEEELERIAKEEPVIRTLLQVPGIGVLTATALYASVGDIHAFKSGRHLASWLGLTPREKSSGERRRLGRITKQGDPYLRTLLIHGARSALLSAERARRAGKTLTHLQAWALERAGEGHTNRAAVALANKLARIAWAIWRHERSFDGDHPLQLAAAA
ncbi:MAG TPA: IS110 family transposase [Longimicrobium sp.]|nr:IS110 family transposase [Longimicrobium sp.]